MAKPLDDNAKERFVDDCIFAKVVKTKEGPAILVAGHVINVASDMPEAAVLLVRTR